MNSLEHVLKTISHQESDRVPIGDFGIGHDHVSRILGRLSVDTKGLFPLCSHNWNVAENDVGEYFEYKDEWGFIYHKPKAIYPKPEILFYALFKDLSWTRVT